MEYLKNTESFGMVLKEKGDVVGFFEKFQKWAERRVFNRISRRVNFLLKRVNDQKLEIIATDNDDKDEDGNWRIRETGGDLVIEKRISGSWTEAQKIAGS